MPKQANRTGPTHVGRHPGAGKKTGPTRHDGPGFGGMGSIPYTGYNSGGTALRIGGGSMQAWRIERQNPKDGPLSTERHMDHRSPNKGEK